MWRGNKIKARKILEEPNFHTSNSDLQLKTQNGSNYECKICHAKYPGQNQSFLGIFSISLRFPHYLNKHGHQFRKRWMVNHYLNVTIKKLFNKKLLFYSNREHPYRIVYMPQSKNSRFSLPYTSRTTRASNQGSSNNVLCITFN